MQEPVELALGQRVGALVLDRVLGGDHHERRVERVGRAVDRDLALLHRLEQRRLRLGRGPVDLVAEDDVGEDGPGRNSNSSVPRFQTVTPTTSDGSRSGVNCTRPNEQSIDAASALARLVLPTPGTSSISRWPSATRHEQRELDHLGLALDDALDVASDPLEHVGEGRCGSLVGPPEGCLRLLCGHEACSPALIVCKRDGRKQPA